jgi:hypothetical protein
MNAWMKTAAAALGMLVPVASASANHYRIMYQGSNAVAVQSGGPPVAGYFAPTAAPPVVPPPPVTPPPPALAVPAVPAAPAAAVVPASANLSANCPTCVPGGTTSANYGAGVPNQIVTFLHPYTGQAITLPLTLPVGRPTIVTRSDRIIYNYGFCGYKVTVKFLPNGQAEVRYRD